MTTPVQHVEVELCGHVRIELRPVKDGGRIRDAWLCLYCRKEFVPAASAELWRTTLVTLSMHDFTSAQGCRRGQTIAARALRGEAAGELTDEARSEARKERRRSRGR